MKYIDPEEIWKQFKNRYLAINIVAKEARKIIETLVPKKEEKKLDESEVTYPGSRLQSQEISVNTEVIDASSSSEAVDLKDVELNESVYDPEAGENPYIYALKVALKKLQRKKDGQF
jgi:hypothetical protein